MKGRERNRQEGKTKGQYIHHEEEVEEEKQEWTGGGRRKGGVEGGVVTGRDTRGERERERHKEVRGRGLWTYQGGGRPT